jgi:hypothetical protein
MSLIGTRGFSAFAARDATKPADTGPRSWADSRRNWA